MMKIIVYKLVKKIVKKYRREVLPAYYKKKFKKYGENVKITERVCIVSGQNLEIDDNTTVNDGAYLNADYGIKIGKNCSISAGAILVSTGLDKEKLIQKSEKDHIGGPIEVGDYSQIGAGAIILPGVTIGKNVIIGAGSVVTKNVPDRSVAYGNPARF